jgi:hypothetical protein
MTTPHDAPVPHGSGTTLMRRVAAEWHALVELWLLPLAVAALPYRAGIALARALARRLPLYRDATAAAAAQWNATLHGGDEAAFRADFRFAQLVDHADLFWALTRSRRFLREKLSAPCFDAPAGRPLVVLSFHYGQGLWLMDALAAQGHPAHFVSIRLDRAEAPSTLAYAYARLRIATVGRLAGVAPIFTGGARKAIGEALAEGTGVYGLVDVPIPGGAAAEANATLLGHPVLLPTGLLESAAGRGASALVLTARVTPTGARAVEARSFPRVEDVDLAMLASELGQRLVAAPASWHFWHLWRSFAARPGSAH